MITKKQKFSVVYFLSRAVFLGIGYSLMFDIAGKDAWISIILGTLLGLLIVYPISKILKYKKDKSLKELLNEMKPLGAIIKFIYFLFLIFLLYECIVIMQTMTTSFFLVNSPSLFIGLSGAVLAILTIKENDTTLFKVAETLIIIGIFTALITFLLLIPYGEIDAFLPIMTTNTKDIIIAALYFTTISTGPLLLSLDFKDDGKTIIKSYLFSALMLLIICILITSVLGPVLIKIYRFPEYMVLKRIKFMKFIEKIENIISIIWILDAFMILASTTQTLKNLLPKKNAKLISSIILIIITFITGIVFGGNYTLILVTYHLVPILLGIFIILILLPIYIYYLKNKKKKGH